MSQQSKGIMSSSSDTLQFHFPTHAASILRKLNTLREEHLFCDITLLLGGPQGALQFHGHRAVLAASSDFLRDQFLLYEGRVELSVGVASSVEIGERLLLSCYTGLLEVPLRELVSYLTAASALQMRHVVEKCAQAVSKYLRPTLAFLKLEGHSKEREIQKPDSNWLHTNLENQEERDAVHPSTSIQEAHTEEEGTYVIQSKSRYSQGPEVDGQGLREAGDDRKVVLTTIEFPEDTAHCLDTLESEEHEDTRPLNTNKKPSHQVQHITGALTTNLPSSIQECIPFTTGVTSVQHKHLVDSSHSPDKDAQKEQKENEEILLLAAQLQECAQLVDSNLFHISGAHLPKSHRSGEEQTAESYSRSMQRPYLCRRCDRVFQHLESYVGHLKEHRQYLCLVCGKGFSHRSNLTHHIRVHTGVKPFRCPLCHKTFSQKARLQDHLNLHTGDKLHKCKYCAVHFAHKAGLRLHLQDVHGKSSLQDMLDESVD